MREIPVMPVLCRTLCRF